MKADYFTPNATAARRLAEIDKICFSEPWSEGMFSDSIENSLYSFIAAQEEGLIVGYIGAVTVCDVSDITGIAVLPEKRRQGIAKELMSEMLSCLKRRGSKRIQLEVRQSNSGAIALYESFGFSLDGIRRDYYKKPTEDAVLMSLDIL